MNEIKLFTKEQFMKEMNKEENTTEKIVRLTIKVDELLRDARIQSIEIARLEGLLLELDGWKCALCESVYADHCKRYGFEHDLCKHCADNDEWEQVERPCEYTAEELELALKELKLALKGAK